jgi:enoyl-CoA hydratase/carnithine racemase
MTDVLLVEYVDDAAVAVLTLNRPARKNALSIELRDEITTALHRLQDDERVRVVVITGAGDVFSAGFDLSEFAAAEHDADVAARLWASSDAYHHAVLACPLPTIAAVNGHAIAGGCDLAVLCDLRIMAHDAAMWHPERTFAEVVYKPLRELVGGSLARELVLTGRRIEAEEAQRIGLANRVVAASEVRAAALELARVVAEAPRPALMKQKAKFLARAGVSSEPGATLDL